MRKGSILYGNFLDKYKIVEHIADGGNSRVYKVETVNDDIYALKILNKGLQTEKIKRFKNEISFCIKANSDYIIKIIDNGITDDKQQMFYVMPLYKKTLREYINEQHEPHEIITMFINILNGVKYYQGRGIIHRDIKPENILISDDSDPVISDFGIAHFLENDIITEVKTKVGSKLANFQYAAPEQREKNGIITNKTDIYALGLIFNEMFTMKIPFGNSYLKVVNINKEYAFLDKVIDKMISQNPSDRYDTVDQIIYEINALISLNKKEKEISELKKIKYEESDEKDVLILEPPKLVDFKYNDTINKLFLYLDKNVNNDWVNCMSSEGYSSILGLEPDKFRFENNIAMVNIMPYQLNELQEIIDYFKSWINNANKHYPKLVYKERNQEKQRMEEAVRERIKKQEHIKNILEQIKI